jgi:hypothetical protein
MLLLAIGLLIIAAAIGVFLIVRFLSGGPLSLEAAIIHGMFTEAGFVLVFVKAYYEKFAGLLPLDLVLLFFTAAGGLSLIMFFHLRGRKIPVGLVLSHASLGIFAFLILVVETLAGR